MEKESETHDPATESASGGEASLHPNLTSIPELAKATVPEVEVRLFRRGRGPAVVFRSSLGGWEQDRLEVRDILHKHGLRSLFAFNPASGRAAPIRFRPGDGRSFLPYSDGAVIFVDGEPKDSLVRPIAKILFGVAVITLLVALLVKETPELFKASRFSGGGFSPWVLACAVVVFVRVRKRAKGFLKRYGRVR